MTDERFRTGPPSSEDALMASALRTPALSQDALERMRATVEREWRAATTAGAVAGKQRAAVSPRLRWYALAVAAVAAVGVISWVARPPAQAVPVGSVARVDEGALSVRSAQAPRRILAQGWELFSSHSPRRILAQGWELFSSHSPRRILAQGWELFSSHSPRRILAQGGELRVLDRVTARGPALVALAQGGTLRISAMSELAVISPSQISLERGLIYLDIPPETGAGNPLRIITSAGAIEHLGTEFEVLSDDQAVRVRVREGRIRFVGRTDTVVADAGTELLAAPGKSIVQRPIDTYGRDWIWTAALAPDYEIEGRSLIGFLRWASRELGRPLNFADANARQIADRTILHGSVSHQAPIDAMSNVLATTSLTYEIRGDAIWVGSGASAAL
jgi:hypothetical protein